MNGLFKLIFWVANCTLLLILSGGFLPSMGAAITRDFLAGTVPIDLMVPVLGVVGVPLTTAIVGLQQRQRQLVQPFSLFELAYALEAPILLVCAIRLFMLRDLTPASTLMLVSGGLGWLASCYWLWQHRQERQPGNLLLLVGLSLFCLVAIYVAAIASFFLLPTLAFVVTSPEITLLSILIFPIFACCVAAFSMPFGIAIVAGKQWRDRLEPTIERYGKWQTWALVSGVAIVWLGGTIALQQQPQLEALSILKQPTVDSAQPTLLGETHAVGERKRDVPKAETSARFHPLRERQANLNKSAQIRAGLVNAYLAEYRYLRDPNDRAVFDAYRWLRFPAEIANGIQASYNLLTRPFTYQGNRNERQVAADLYAEFFDESILRGELPTIRHAVESDFNRAQANAGLWSIDAKRVLLTNQQVTVAPHGDWADVELHETYRNHTSDLQEVFYYFSLPESATLTGVWLGDTEDRNQRYPFQISTRGAAQKVYKQEMQRRVDPALLEQVGPQNYRLRIYPIQTSQPTHMWMTYKVFKRDGAWPLPHLAERRNVYWNRLTHRTIAGKSVDGAGDWLPKSIAAEPALAQVHQLTLPDGNHVIAKPFDPKNYSLPKNQRLAIVLDGSYSMNAHRAEIENTMAWLQTKILPDNQLDLYQTASTPALAKFLPFGGFKLSDAIFYGKIEPQQMLSQFQTLSQANSAPKYDAIVVVTDRGSYELSNDRQPELALPAPLWMVHLGGLPHAYDDTMLASIQHGGGSVATEIATVMQRIATQPSLGQGTSLLSVVDNYAWFLSQAKDPSAAPDDNFEPIAARQWITQVSQSLKPSQLKELDAVHVLAKRYNVVTPYSSAIVLINDRQKADLKAAEGDRDRFQREGEDKQLPSPQAVSPLSSPSVSATPEPAEWLLLAIACGLLAAIYRHNSTRLLAERDDRTRSLRSN